VFLDVVQKTLIKHKKYTLILTDDEYDKIKKLMKILLLFEDSIEILQGENYSTINLVILFYLEIKER
jgi:hypothetical protein